MGERRRGCAGLDICPGSEGEILMQVSFGPVGTFTVLTILSVVFYICYFVVTLIEREAKLG